MTSDPGYDVASGRWVFNYDPKSFTPFIISTDGVTMDFTRDVPGWQSPADNRIILDTGTAKTYNFMMSISAADTVFAGFEVRGSFDVAAIVLRTGALDNQLGPGLVLAGITKGFGVLMRGSDVTGNKVVGSWCGIHGDGTVVDRVYDDCIAIEQGANANVVGGPTAADRNILAATTLGFGVAMRDDATRANVVQGNYIGTDVTGTQGLGTESGVEISGLASDNKVLDNVVSGNRGSGIFATDASRPFGRTPTVVEGNRIGTDVSGEHPLPNGGFGLRIEGQSNDVRAAHNTVRFNKTGGIFICGNGTRNNTLTENRITDNHGPAIQLCAGANGGVRPPVILEASGNRASGQACAGCRVELFSDPGEQADTFEGFATADPAGAWVVEKPEGFTYPNLTATATDGQNTSALSVVRVWSPDVPPTPTRQPTVTPTVDGSRPTVTPGTPSAVFHELFLPWFGRSATR
jgi:parallel beta-helix repeat protein